jgi:hypothetical protein
MKKMEWNELSEDELGEYRQHYRSFRAENRGKIMDIPPNNEVLSALEDKMRFETIIT